jgi:O-antigen/teichoic acid export membrane protein
VPAVTVRTPFERALGWGAASFVLVAVIGVAGSVVVARLYGIATIGAFALALAPCGLMGVVASAREQVALVGELAGAPAATPRVRSLFVAAFAFSTVVSAAVGAIVMLATWALLAGPIGRPDLIAPAAVLLAGHVLVTNAGTNVDSLLIAFRVSRGLCVVRVAQEASYVALAVAGALTDLAVWALVAAMVGSRCLGLVLRVPLVRPVLGRRPAFAELCAGVAELPGLVRFGLRVTPGAVADGLASSAGTWLVGLVAPVAAVGAYSRAWGLAFRFRELCARIGEVLFPVLAEHRAWGRQSAFDATLTRTMRWALAGMLLPAAVGAGAADGIMRLFGSGFEAGAGALAVALVVPPLAAVSEAFGHALTACGRPLVPTGAAIGRTLVAIVTGYVLLRQVGIAGVPLGLALGYLAGIPPLALAVRRHVGTPPSRWIPGRVAATVAAACLAGFTASRQAEHLLAGASGTAAALVVGTAAYLAVVLAAELLARRAVGESALEAAR